MKPAHARPTLADRLSQWTGSGVRSPASPGGNRAWAMLIRQPVCDTEMVPSLHSNRGVAPAAGAGTGGGAAATCGGAGACAAGFCDQAQPAQDMAEHSRISRAGSVRIAIAFAKTAPADGGAGFRRQSTEPQICKHTMPRRDSDMPPFTAA